MLQIDIFYLYSTYIYVYNTLSAHLLQYIHIMSISLSIYVSIIYAYATYRYTYMYTTSSAHTSSSEISFCWFTSIVFSDTSSSLNSIRSTRSRLRHELPATVPATVPATATPRLATRDRLLGTYMHLIPRILVCIYVCVCVYRNIHTHIPRILVCIYVCVCACVRVCV